MWRYREMARYGGVLPYAWSHGQILLLLGREKYVKNWSGSRRWSPFGGGVDPGETPTRAALREGYEETMGMFGTPAELARRVDRKAWKHRGGVTLLLPVEHDINVPRYFRNVYKYARRCRGGRCPEGWYEKTHVRWVPLARAEALPLRPEFRQSMRSLKRYFSARAAAAPHA